MACRLDGAKPLSEPMLDIVNWTLRNKLQWNSNRNSNIFIHENALENVVCEMASILPPPQCVNSLIGVKHLLKTYCITYESCMINLMLHLWNMLALHKPNICCTLKQNLLNHSSWLGIGPGSSSTFHPCCSGKKVIIIIRTEHIEGLVQDCSISIVNPLEILQTGTKPLMYQCWSNFNTNSMHTWKFYQKLRVPPTNLTLSCFSMTSCRLSDIDCNEASISLSSFSTLVATSCNRSNNCNAEITSQR